MKLTLTFLRPFSDIVGKKEILIDFKGANVSDLLGRLLSDHPGLKEHLVEADGSFTNYLSIFVNDKPLSALNDIETELHDGDSLLFFFPVAGG